MKVTKKEFVIATVLAIIVYFICSHFRLFPYPF